MVHLSHFLFWPFKRSKKTTIEHLEELDDEILDAENARTSNIDMQKKNEKLKKLQAEKQKLLEEVMERETFNKAQQILKRFDPLKFGLMTAERKGVVTPAFTDLENNNKKNTSIAYKRSSCTASLSTLSKSYDNLLDKASTSGDKQLKPTTDIVKPRLLRPLLPRERTFMDRIIDVVVGDGPNKRYALICQECASHNGMALEEEFEYLAFRCCYCNYFNPARHVRLSKNSATNLNLSRSDLASIPESKSLADNCLDQEVTLPVVDFLDDGKDASETPLMKKKKKGDSSLSVNPDDCDTETL